MSKIIHATPARKFSTGASAHQKRQMSAILDQEGHFGANLTTLYVGISAVIVPANGSIAVAIAVHDCTYLVDFSVKHISLDTTSTPGSQITDYVIHELERYEHEVGCFDELKRLVDLGGHWLTIACRTLSNSSALVFPQLSPRR